SSRHACARRRTTRPGRASSRLRPGRRIGRPPCPRSWLPRTAAPSPAPPLEEIHLDDMPIGGQGQGPVNPRQEKNVSERAALRLHVPEPAVRPGDAPDFSNVVIAKAGSVRRPEPDAEPESIRDLAYSIIRVLNRDGEAVGPWAGLLSDGELLEGLRHMLTLRTFDARMLMAQRQGKTSFYMQHMGEEAVS